MTTRAAGGERLRAALPLAAAALAGLAFRLLYWHQLAATPAFLSPVLDGAAHLEWARGFLAGTWPGPEPFFRAPGYPWALAAAIRVLGDDPERLARVQLLLGCVTAVLTAGLAGRLFGRTAAWVAGIGAALYPTFAFFDAQLLAPALAVPLALAAGALSVGAVEDGGSRRAFWAGMAWGVAGVVRPPLLLAGLVTAGAVARRARPGWRPAVWGLAGLLTLPLLVTARNGMVGDPAFVASQGGLNFYLGNGRDANGMAATFHAAPTALGYDMMRAATSLAEKEAGRRLRPTEVSRFWARRAGAEIAEDPGRWLRLLGKKVAVLALDREIPNNHDPALFAERIPLLRLPGWLIWGPLGVVGAGLARRRAGARLLAAIALAILAGAVLFFVNARFRLPAVPFLIVLASGAVVQIGRRVRHRPRTAVAPLAVVLVLLGAARANPFGIPRGPWPMAYVLVAEAERDRGEPGRALRWLDRALAAEPGLYPAVIGRIDLLRETSRLVEARAVAEAAVAALPGDARLRAELASLLDLTGDPAAALVEIDRAIALDPGFDPARVHRAIILARLGRRAEAEAALQRFLEERPHSPEAARARSVRDDVAAGRLDPAAD